MKNVLKNAFNVALCGAGATAATLGGILLAVDQSCPNGVIQMCPNFSGSETTQLATAFLLGTSFFIAGQTRFATDSKTLKFPKPTLRGTFNGTLAFAGGCTAALAALIIWAAPETVTNPVVLGMAAGGTAAFAAGYSKVFGEKKPQTLPPAPKL